LLPKIVKKIHIIILLFILPILLFAQALRFPKIKREGTNIAPVNSAWKVIRQIEPDLDGESIFSLRYHADGKSVIIGTTNFNLFRIDLESGKKLWKAPAKMMYQKEFDGPEIFDVSYDGKHFLSFGMSNPEVQASERFLVLRSANNGNILKKFPVLQSLFYSERAAVDYRYPGTEEEKRREEDGIGFNWIMTIDSAMFIEGGKKILATYKHNMDGPHFYDRRLIIYDTSSGKKLQDFQLVADPETANFDQPGGFEIGHFQFPYAYSSSNKSVLFGTSHGRIHEIDESIMTKNFNTPLIEDKACGKIIYIPKSDSPDLDIKDRQSVRGLAISPNGKNIFVSAGTEGGYIQFYAFNKDTKKEIFRSSFFDAGKVKSPSDSIVVLGGMFSSAKFFIADVSTGQLLFSSDEEENYVNPNIFDTHPTRKEVIGLSSGNHISIIRPNGQESSW